MIRLNKFLSQAGIASRREADRMIAEGRVKVNARVVYELGIKVDAARDRVEVNGRKVKREIDLIYVLLNKPPGYLVTLKDPFGRPTVKDLMPLLKKRVFPVGRLDYESQGALLLTNDGELAHRLAHPKYKVLKTYLVKVSGDPQEAALAKLAKGVFIEGKRTAPAKISRLTQRSGQGLLKIEIHEGRKREIRKMCEAVGHPVIELKRTSFAGLQLESLRPGQWRFLKASEVQKLKKLVGTGAVPPSHDYRFK